MLPDVVLLGDGSEVRQSAGSTGRKAFLLDLEDDTVVGELWTVVLWRSFGILLAHSEDFDFGEYFAEICPQLVDSMLLAPQGNMSSSACTSFDEILHTRVDTVVWDSSACISSVEI